MNLLYEVFYAYFEILCVGYGAKVDERLCQVYYVNLKGTNPTEEELEHAVSALLDNRLPLGYGQIPDSRAIKDLIFDHRKAAAPALPPAPIKRTSAKEARLLVLAGVYRHQGDTDFYRSLLNTNTSVFGVKVPEAPVSHEEVVAYVERAES